MRSGATAHPNRLVDLSVRIGASTGKPIKMPRGASKYRIRTIYERALADASPEVRKAYLSELEGILKNY